MHASHEHWSATGTGLTGATGTVAVGTGLPVLEVGTELVVAVVTGLRVLVGVGLTGLTGGAAMSAQQRVKCDLLSYSYSWIIIYVNASSFILYIATGHAFNRSLTCWFFLKRLAISEYSLLHQ